MISRIFFPWGRISRFSTLCTVWKLRNFTATIFAQKFRESNFLLNTFTLNWFDEKICMSVNLSLFQRVVWKLQKFSLTSHFFRKNFVKAMVLLKKSLNSWFDEIFYQWERSYRFSTLCCGCLTLWNNEKFSLTKIFFRQISSLVTSLVETLISRYFCQKCVRVNFRNFRTVCPIFHVKNEYFCLIVGKFCVKSLHSIIHFEGFNFTEVFSKYSKVNLISFAFLGWKYARSQRKGHRRKTRKGSQKWAPKTQKYCQS